MTPHIWFFVGLGFTALLLAAGHWAPWYLNRMRSYAYGVGTIVAGFALWRFMVGDWMTPIGLAAISLIAGITVWLGYKLDDLAVELRKVKKLESVEKAHDRNGKL